MSETSTTQYEYLKNLKSDLDAARALNDRYRKALEFYDHPGWHGPAHEALHPEPEEKNNES